MCSPPKRGHGKWSPHDSTRMGFLWDRRLVGIPCVLAASVLQYVRFAKKPMAAPCHRVTERGARRLLVIGLVAEFVSLAFLPLSQACPMNASCLVFLYFWKESKRAQVLQLREAVGEVFVCFLALSAWALPFLDPGGRDWPEAVQAASLLETLLAPRSKQGDSLWLCVQGNVFVSCLPPAMNFGVSALLLKAAAQVASGILQAPQRSELWAALPVLLLLLFTVRSAAASPLRRALEAHDTLRVLAAYGVLSGIAAAVTGALIYGELAGWTVEKQGTFAAVLALHCWGMRGLGATAEPRGSPPQQKAKTEEDEGSAKGSSAAPPAEGPLLNFDEVAARRRTVDDDAMMEEQLFARALAPLSTEEVDTTGAGEAAPQFDADFEELMRRFDEDDRATAQPITELALESPEDSPPPAAAILPDTTPAHQPVLTLDAEMLLDSNANEDEDELLKGIEDLP
ncbi:hypothetical protein AK812_SmicGene14890 [Symbiodinium microadriaticum]|uniref:Transmembrane protein n=1 Tax=Symbiodinium microadriaticum TaxID=2951 RepID=A0A1Q9E4F8_SYMMI|nr:hypothetical protein AK812_SmicGene14890 [Symbiodinium microadriaticum]